MARGKSGNRHIGAGFEFQHIRIPGHCGNGALFHIPAFAADYQIVYAVNRQSRAVEFLGPVMHIIPARAVALGSA